MKILLVKPKARLKTINKLNALILLEPLELGYVAAAVPPGHETEVLDLRLTRFPDRAFRKALKIKQPDIVGISGYTHEVTKVIELAAMVRKCSPKTCVVVGGHHATVLPDDYNRGEFNAIVRGEGCAPFRAIIERLEAGKELNTIEHVLVPGKHYDYKKAKRLPVFPSPDELPNPRRDLWNSKPYRCVWPCEKHQDWQTIFPQVALLRTSFGCYMSCNFCVVPMLSQKRHMPRDPKKVVDELQSIEQQHVYLCDDETFINPGHAWAVAREIEKRGIKKRYFAWARSTTVNRHPELFEFWRGIGLDCVFLGMEAVTDQQLKDLSKQSSVEENQKAHQALLNMEISVQAGFMVNADYGEEEFSALFEYLKHLPSAQVTCTVFTPSPGSQAWHSEKKNYICHPYDLHDCMHPLTNTRMPLKKFYRWFSQTATIGGKRNPLRSMENRLLIGDVFLIIRAITGYSRALKNAWKDFPKTQRS